MPAPCWDWCGPACAPWRSFAARRPRVVVVVGGYASFPAGLAAVLTRAPLVLVTTDAVPGAVNALLARFAAANAVAFAGTDRHAQGPGDRHAGAARVGPPRPLGSRPIGGAGRAGAAHRPDDGGGGRWLARGLAHQSRRVRAGGQWPEAVGTTLYHVTGRRDFAQFARPDGAAPASPTGPWYQVVPYEDRMTTVFGAADVCVSRAGAMTVAELLLAGLPAVLVPLPGAPGDHQTKNAQALVDAGAAVLVPDAECTAERLDAELTALLGDADRLRQWSRRPGP